jgi:hypothetical protein
VGQGVRPLVITVTAMALLAAWAGLRQLSTPTAHAEPPAIHAGPAEVRSISLDGRRLPESQLRAVLETRVGAPLDRDRLDRDRRAMERALADLGYLAAHVEPASVTLDAAGAAYVTFALDQGALFHLRSVAVTGPGRGAAVVTLAAGDDAISSRIASARQALSDLLARRGSPAAVELSVQTDVAAAAVDVVFATHR